ncbi:hypothetical protein T4B_6742, partial [Trichinella pseudospiralis]
MALSTRKHKAVLILVFGFRLFVFIHFANEPYFLRTSRNDDTYQQRKNAEFDKIMIVVTLTMACFYLSNSDFVNLAFHIYCSGDEILCDIHSQTLVTRRRVLSRLILLTARTVNESISWPETFLMSFDSF